MSNLQLSQAQFMIAAGQKLLSLRQVMRQKNVDPQVILYYNLIEEEVGELEEAFIAYKNSVHENERIAALSVLLDAVCDVAVVLMGLCNSLGLPFHAGFDEVHRSNMRKCQLVDGEFKIVKREDGKILKPEDWSPPDLINLLRYKLVSGE